MTTSTTQKIVFDGVTYIIHAKSIECVNIQHTFDVNFNRPLVKEDAWNIHQLYMLGRLHGKREAMAKAKAIINNSQV